MAAAPISIKLRCASWQQLASIYKRDLSRNAIFLKSASPPPLGTPVRIDLTLPSESMVVLSGSISKHVQAGELDGRGPGVDVRLNSIPQSAMWLIETALASADKKSGSTQAIPVQPRAATPPTGTPRVAPSPAPAPAPARAPSEAEAAIGDGSDLAAAETELVVALNSELESLKRLNPFQVLGLGYEATDADVRAAFGELTKRYHPDRYARFASPDLKNLAAEIFILIRDAYRRLGDEAARASVMAQLGPRKAAGPARPPVPRASTVQGPPPLPLPPPPAPVVAARPPPPAVKIPEAAPPPPPPPPATSGAGDISMAESMLDAGKYDEALAYYRILSKKNPSDRLAKAGIELAEGLRAMSARDRLEAAQRFEAVLELDPANERAARELAEMRRLATNERKGMLSRLLGKKE